MNGLLAEYCVSGVLVYEKRPAPSKTTRIAPGGVTAMALSLNTVCPYYTMFPLEFPLEWLSGAKTGEWVLDPFCGRGTTLSYLSNQMPRTYGTKPDAAIRFWQKRGLICPPAVDIVNTIHRRVYHSFASAPPPVAGEVHLGDARRAHRLLSPLRRFSWVITSPPYFGMRTYRPDQWLRNWFLGGKPRVDYAQEGQLAYHAGKFVDELAAVWRAVARRCMPGARLIVRFGYLPSIPIDARDLLRSSLARADAGWRVTRWLDAGSSSNGKRQSHQFGRCTDDAACEIDAYACLEA